MLDSCKTEYSGKISDHAEGILKEIAFHGLEIQGSKVLIMTQSQVMPIGNFLLDAP